jgi:hypothetical protein
MRLGIHARLYTRPQAFNSWEPVEAAPFAAAQLSLEPVNIVILDADGLREVSDPEKFHARFSSGAHRPRRP